MARAKRHYLPGHIWHITHRASCKWVRWKKEDGRGKQLLPSKKIEEGRKKTSVRPGSSALGCLAEDGQEAIWVVYGKKIDGS